MIPADTYRRLKHERDQLAHDAAMALIRRNPARALELARQMHALDQQLEQDRTTTEGDTQS